MLGWLPGVTSVPGEPLYLGRLLQEKLSVWFPAIIAEGPDCGLLGRGRSIHRHYRCFFLLRAVRASL